MNKPHSLSLGIAPAALLALLASGFVYIRPQEDAHTYAPSGRVFHQKARGIAMQQLALDAFYHDRLTTQQ